MPCIRLKSEVRTMISQLAGFSCSPVVAVACVIVSASDATAVTLSDKVIHHP